MLEWIFFMQSFVAFGQKAYFAFPNNSKGGKGDAKEVAKEVARPPSLFNLTYPNLM